MTAHANVTPNPYAKKYLLFCFLALKGSGNSLSTVTGGLWGGTCEDVELLSLVYTRKHPMPLETFTLLVSVDIPMFLLSIMICIDLWCDLM